MTTITETLCAIERRADRALVQELRVMTQEILALRFHLCLENRAHADALLLKLDHLARCQQVEPVADIVAGPVTQVTRQHASLAPAVDAQTFARGPSWSTCTATMSGTLNR